MKIKTLKSSLRTLPPNARPLSRPGRGGSAEKRAPSSVRTKRRLKMWTRDPYCAACRRLTDYPQGFELDHVIPLHKGGEDTEGNSQVLCIPCHDDKTRIDLGQTVKQAIGADGWAVEPAKQPFNRTHSRNN